MNINFFKKINNTVNTQQKTFSKPTSETSLSSELLWLILLASCLAMGIFVTLFTIYSYRFLTEDRVGVADTTTTSMPKINADKIKKIDTFFEQREKLTESVYQKIIIEP